MSAPPWVLLVAALLAGGDEEQQAVPEFAVSVDTVMLDVSVMLDGELVQDLTADDFEVKDDGVVQDADLVSGDERALQAVLVLDTSSSVAGRRLDSLKRAAKAFIGGLSPEDAVSVIAFSHRVYALPSDPHDHARLIRAVEDLTSGGSTALNDAVFAGLLRSEGGSGRPMVLVFSDNADRLSWLEPRPVLEAARMLNGVVYGVLSADPGSEDQARGGLLGEMVDLTGGTVLTTGSGDLVGVFRRILATVQSRYVLRYVPRGVKTAGWHPIQVRLKRAEGEVRARSGYRRLE